MAFASASSRLAGLMIWVICLGLHAENPSSGDTGNFRAYAEAGFRKAQGRYASSPRDVEAAWQFARASFDLADLATNRTERTAVAERGIAAAREAVALKPNVAAAHYYLGMTLAQLAQTKTLGALKLVPQMEHEFSLARELDEHFDYAGPDRNLGLLYRDAPAIGSIGSRTKAREHLRRAVELAAQYPENGLNLLEACLKWGDRNEARSELKALEDVWLIARTNFAGAAWAASWADWEARLKKVKSAPVLKARPTPRSKP